MSWDFNQRIQAAVYILVTGSVKETSALTSIPERTLRHWMQQNWWSSVMEQAKSIKNQELDSMWTQVLHSAVEQLKDRLAYGDYKVTKSGTTVRVPLSGNQLVLIGAIATDKRDKVRVNKAVLPKEEAEKLVDVTKELEDLALEHETKLQKLDS